MNGLNFSKMGVLLLFQPPTAAAEVDGQPTDHAHASIKQLATFDSSFFWIVSLDCLVKHVFTII